MYAVTHLHFSPKGDFASRLSKTCKGLTMFLRPPETLGADTGNPGK